MTESSPIVLKVPTALDHQLHCCRRMLVASSQNLALLSSRSHLMRSGFKDPSIMLYQNSEPDANLLEYSINQVGCRASAVHVAAACSMLLVKNHGRSGLITCKIVFAI
eukprot:109449-Amphidinium_carterae.1